MNELITQLFGLDQMRPGDEGVDFAFARPFPAWAWALGVLAVVLFAGWSYWRLIGSRFWRTVLATLRTLTLIVLLVVIAGPQLVRLNEHIERDWVVMLADRTASMGVRDADVSGSRITRDEQLRSALRESWTMLSGLGEDRNVLWLGFDAGAYDLRAIGEGIDLGEPDGVRTNLDGAIAQALRRVAARPVSGIVILSDGRTGEPPSRDTLRRVQNELIPVFAVPMGSPEALSDIAVRSAEAPRLAFVDDVVPVVVDLERTGAGESGGATVRLIDDDTGLVLDEQRVEPGALADGSASVTLTSRPDTPGASRWSVRVSTDREDLIEENNAAAVEIELLDDTLRVVYFDGYPRWERTYLKNLLLRERSIDSSSLMLAPNRRYTQDGDTIIATLPRSPEEWGDFDVVILGDLRPDVFSEEQIEQLREHIAVRGAGLLWIGGPGATPQSWRSTPLGDLLPFRDDPALWDEAVSMAPTPNAERLGLLRTGVEDGRPVWHERLSDPGTGWSLLRSAQRIDWAGVKPAAEVLATATPISSGVAPGEDATPAVLSMRYGAGSVVYVATDEIWRWRYGRGEALPERFWVPLIRHLGRASLALSGRSAVLEATPTRAMVDQPIAVRLRLLDQSLLDAAPRSVGVVIERVGAEPGAPVRLTLAPDAGERAGEFGATWIAAEPGAYVVRADEALLAGQALEAAVQVHPPDDEFARPETDHPGLAALAEKTGGAVLMPAELDRLPELLPNRRQVVPTAPDIETLWDRPIVLGLLLTLLTLEWVGRRLARLS